MKIEVKYTEQLIRTIIKEVGPKAFMIALHNAFSHGVVVSEAGFHADREMLEELYESFDRLIALAKDIEGG